ncbi:hypothetical protein LWI28_012581 [Acer negundo]|uniref:GDSL esterase/lipase n=1 Tax=Acer negundo TaxID=4023 RepID=A0AAD5JN63_ACENE|nr:hypothetical protein LWI28_012581 [Acer negundo]
MATGDIILKGVNYASAGSGILNDTGKGDGDHIGLEAQITNFGKTKQDIITRIGTTAATSLLRESLYIIAIVSNDIVNDLVAILISRDAYFDMLISTFRSQLIRLYYLGARKIVVTNCACIGSIPLRRVMPPNEFIFPLNQVAQNYNSRLKKLLTELTASLPGSMYVYSDVYASFENVDSPCCHGIGPFDQKLACTTGQVCQEFGLGFTPPYLAPTTKGSVVLLGVNYASGGGGILNETGKIFGGRINLDAQLDNFANTRQDIISSIGAPAALKLLQMSLFSVTIGSNDFINNYFTPVLSIAKQKLVPPETFVATMMSKFRLQLTRLYDLGARKVIVANVGPIGCIPYQRDMNPSAGGSCAALPNQMAQLFNIQLKSLVAELGSSLEGSKLVYADVFRIVEDIIQNYRSYGFENADYACCYVAGRSGGRIPCGPPSKVCTDRSKYVFWDPYHPSDATNVIIAKRLLDGDSDDISPVNVRKLVEEA